MDVIHELSSNHLLCLFFSISIGYMIGKVEIKGLVLGSTLGTLIVAIALSYLGGTLDPRSEPFYFSIFLFAVGYDGGENISNVFNRSTFKSIILSIVMTLSAILAIYLVMKIFHLNKAMAVGIASGALTQSAIMASANDAFATISNLPPDAVSQFNANVTEGFSASCLFGLVGAIVWSTLIIEFMFKKKIYDDAHHESLCVEETNTSGTEQIQPKHSVFVFCNGLALGMILSLLKVTVFGVAINLGINGCLISGLLFGYINHKRPNILVMDRTSIRFLQDFGIAAFMAAVGLSSGNKVIQGIMNNGLDVVAASIIVTIIPLLISTLVGYYILKYKNIALLSGAVIGARTANSASGIVLHKAGNSVPMQAFMVPFIFSSILLTFIGPIIVFFM